MNPMGVANVQLFSQAADFLFSGFSAVLLKIEKHNTKSCCDWHFPGIFDKLQLHACSWRNCDHEQNWDSVFMDGGSSMAKQANSKMWGSFYIRSFLGKLRVLFSISKAYYVWFWVIVFYPGLFLHFRPVFMAKQLISVLVNYRVGLFCHGMATCAPHSWFTQLENTITCIPQTN